MVLLSRGNHPEYCITTSRYHNIAISIPMACSPAARHVLSVSACHARPRLSPVSTDNTPQAHATEMKKRGVRCEHDTSCTHRQASVWKNNAPSVCEFGECCQGVLMTVHSMCTTGENEPYSLLMLAHYRIPHDTEL